MAAWGEASSARRQPRGDFSLFPPPWLSSCPRPSLPTVLHQRPELTCPAALYHRAPGQAGRCPRGGVGPSQPGQLWGPQLPSHKDHKLLVPLHPTTSSQCLLQDLLFELPFHCKDTSYSHVDGARRRARGVTDMGTGGGWRAPRSP